MPPRKASRCSSGPAAALIVAVVGLAVCASAQIGRAATDLGEVGLQVTPTPLSLAEFESLHRLIKPHAGESRWQEIDWYPSVWEARQKAAQQGKPLFLWAGSGGAPPAGC